MEMMQSVYYAADQTIAIRKVEVPPVLHNMVKIKTKYAALCATDLHMVTMGMLGAILLNMIVLSGAANITAIEPIPEKRTLALEMGAAHAIDPFSEDVKARTMEITGEKGFDHVFEVSGSPKAAEVCLDILAHCGKITYFAVFPPTYEMKLNLYDLYMKEANIQTVFTNHCIFPRAIQLIERIQAEKIIGKVMPLKQAVEAFALFQESKYPKILLEC